MPANIETMMYHGAVPWHGLGTPVTEAATAEEALVAAGLDWNVQASSIFTDDGTLIPGFVANQRDRDQAILGAVSDRYRVVQNREAFAWLDELVGEGLRFETAGALKGGQRVWMTARLPQRYTLVGDPVVTYLTFTNGHDGRHAVQVAVSPVRVVCENTLNVALERAPRMWSAIHAVNIHARMDEARKTLSMTEAYLARLDAQAQVWANQPLSYAEWTELVADITPVKTLTPAMEAQRMAISSALYRPDQAEFANTVWGAVNAVSWFTSHREHPRNPDRAMETFVDGDRLMTRLMSLVSPEPVEDDDEEVIEI